MTAPPEPVGTVHVIDPSPLNWLFITWNTMEEPIRIDDPKGTGPFILQIREPDRRTTLAMATTSK